VRTLKAYFKTETLIALNSHIVLKLSQFCRLQQRHQLHYEFSKFRPKKGGRHLGRRSGSQRPKNML